MSPPHVWDRGTCTVWKKKKTKKKKNLQARSCYVRFDKGQALSDVLPCLGGLCWSTGGVNVSSKMRSRTRSAEHVPGHSAPWRRGKGGCAGLEMRFGDQGCSQDKLRVLRMWTNTAAPWGILFGIYGPGKGCLGLCEAVGKMDVWRRPDPQMSRGVSVGFCSLLCWILLPAETEAPSELIPRLILWGFHCAKVVKRCLREIRRL